MIKGQELSGAVSYEYNQKCYRTWGEDDPLLVLTTEFCLREGKNVKHIPHEPGKWRTVL